VTISEPSTLLTDYLLSGVALVLGVRLWKVAPPSGSTPGRLWAGAFLVGAAAAVAGGTVHGFRASLPPPLHHVLWTGCLMAGALSGALLVGGAASQALRATAHRLVRAAGAVVLIAALGLLASEPLTHYAVWTGAVWIVSLLVLVALSARKNPSFAAAVALGLALAGAGLMVQAAGLGLHTHFNHNDLCHVLLTAALWPFYRAGRAMSEKPGAASQAGFTPA
jgi:Family of unknown function (DUF6962)